MILGERWNQILSGDTGAGRGTFMRGTRITGMKRVMDLTLVIVTFRGTQDGDRPDNPPV